MSKPISPAEMRDWVNETWQKCLDEGGNMTGRELMKQALDALETKGEHHPRVYQAIAVLRNRLAQPEQEFVINCPRCGHCCPQSEQEPVAWANKDDLQNFDMRVRTGGGVYHTVPLYTTPPPRPWVGLTDEEIMDCTHHLAKNENETWIVTDSGLFEFAHILEEMLKGKNK